MVKRKKSEPDSGSKKRPRGRQKGHRITVQASNVISGLADQLKLIRPALTFQDIADQLTERAGMTVTRATVWRFANGIYPAPHAVRLRHALGLPVTVAVAVCPHCGKPPLSKRHKCLSAERKPRRPSLRARRKRLWHSEIWRAACATMRR